MPSENGSSCLDRIERALELLVDDHIQFREEHKQFLTSQVLLTDTIQKLAVETEARFQDLAESQKHTDERLNALIQIVDEIIRRPRS